MQRAFPTLASVVLALAFATFGCAGAQEAEIIEAPTGKPISEKGKRWGGWRWSGKRNDCFFKHKNQCFDKLADACAAARCKKGLCAHDKSAPANVGCRK